MTTDRLGKYEIRGILGKGAMGTVYAALDPIISRQVAIKTVRLPDASDIDAQEELSRFKREAQAAGRLTHPNIVGIFDYGETDEVAYIVMEFVDGRTLKSVLDAQERMPIATIGKIMADLLAGLAYSHERGVVHRDIKPANVMIVGGDGHGSGQAKIADFGIARIESSNLTQAGTIMGTPAYMSPEQFMGQTVDARTDIYSSGVLLFQLLTGERPFEGSMATIMHKALNTQPPRPSELSVTAPVALDAVVARAMGRRPDDRYPNAAAFAEAIVAALEGRSTAPPPGLEGLGGGLGDLDGESTVVRPATRPTPAARPSPAAVAPPTIQPPARPRTKAPLLAAVAVLLLAGGGAGAAWWAGMFSPTEPPNPQIAGGTRTVTPPGEGQNPVVAVTPPRTPVSTPTTNPVSPPQTASTTEPTPATTPTPTPRADVTQVVPPSTTPTTPGANTSAANTFPGNTPTQPAQIIPPAPSRPTPPPRRTEIAGAPPLEPAQVAPPPTAIVPTPTETRPPVPTTRPAERTNVASNTSVEPALVTPPASATVSPAAPARVEPAPAAPVAPSQARSPEPATAVAALPTEAVVPPETPPPPPNPPATSPTVTAAVPPGTPPPPPPNTLATPPTVTPPTVTPPTVTAAVVTPEALRRAVSAAVQSADCAAVHGDLSRSGTLSLQGVIGDGAPTQDLLQRLREAAPNAPLDWTVEEAAGPYCGALNVIHAYARPFGSTSGGMDVGLRDGRTNLIADDKIDIHAQIPAYTSYLQLDYFSSDGSVLHVQTAAQGNPTLPARSTQTYVPGTVAPPFGTDLIVAIASSVPLFSKGQKLPDETEPYLHQLRSALDAAAKRRAELAAGAVVVHTSPKS